jgi:hypothetical protein
MEQTYELLNAIIVTHIRSDTGGELLPSMLYHIGKFTEYVACKNYILETDHCNLGPCIKSIPLLRLSGVAANSRSYFREQR